MVQKKMPNKLGISADAVEAQSWQANMKMKPSLNHLDSCNTKGAADQLNNKKKMKMKMMLRPFKRIDNQGPKPSQGRYEGVKPAVIRTMPNYMRSTSSSEARIREEEKKKRASQIGSMGSKKQVSICEAKVDEMQRPTCSSTLKDSKFPPYLVLNPGSGTCVFKVCPYTYCSLNGHYYHNPVTPLKQFLSTRRHALKTQRINNVEAAPFEDPEVEQLDPGTMIIHDQSSSAADKDYWSDFFIEIHVQKRDAAVETEGDSETESLAGGGGGGGEKDVAVPDMDSLNTLEDDLAHEVAEEEAQRGGGEPDRESSAGGFLDEILILEWKEGKFPGDISSKSEKECEILYSNDELSSMAGEVTSCEFLEERKADQMLPTSHEEITECQDCFSDLDSSIDIGEWQNIVVVDDVDQSTEKSSFPDDCQSTLISSASSVQQLEEAVTVEEVMKVNSEIEEEILKEDSVIQDDTSIQTKDETWLHKRDKELLSETEINPPRVIVISRQEEPKGNKRSCEKAEAFYFDWDTTESINTDQIRDLETDANAIEDRDGFEEQEQFSEGSSNQEKEVADTCDTSKRAVRSKKTMEDDGEQRGFNPREPNYLALEPDPEAEKVDLRHQEMDEKKNAEEWMLDYALQRAVSKLAPARKKKVALLVAAFETIIIPVPKCETNHMRQSGADFTHMILMQACS
ncbi:hypothetical protein Dimus_018902 [Dionaea muscipula]